MSYDTIVAVATPPGRGGIGVVRISGPQALPLALGLIDRSDLAPNQARFCRLLDPETGRKLDEAVATYYRAPRSYTGEDVVEVAAHGAPVLLNHVLGLLTKAGARLAAPGEFTERAFLAGRLDLTQAEAVRDLIEAQTLFQAQTAAAQLGGALSRRITPLKQDLLALIAQLEAGIDFAEDDTPVLRRDDISARLGTLSASLGELEHSFTRGRLITEGMTLAIVGRPNAGKSSLFNRLLDRERSIVTAEPGTTRDTVAERLAIAGIPVELVDTAGLREAASEAERIGILRSREAFADAGVVLLVLDATAPLNEEERALVQAARDRPLLIACNKADLPLAGPDLRAVREVAPEATAVRTSAVTGEGLDALRSALTDILAGSSAPESALLTNLRQHAWAAAARQACAAAQSAADEAAPHELILLDLHAAREALDALTGITTTDDILRQIFSTFCIGK